MKLQKHFILLIIFILVLITGCSSGDSNADTKKIPSDNIISGLSAAGPINNAIIKIRRIDTDELLNEGITNEEGRYSINIGSYTGAVSASSQGGKYTDEIDGEEKDATNITLIAISVVNKIEGFVVNITPVTSIAVKKLQKLYPNKNVMSQNEEDITKENIKIAKILTGEDFNPTKVTPKIVGQKEVKDNTPQNKYGLLLASLAKLTHGNSSEVQIQIEEFEEAIKDNILSQEKAEELKDTLNDPVIQGNVSKEVRESIEEASSTQSLLDVIRNYIDGSLTTPSLQQYKDAAIKGVTSANLNAVNARVKASETASTDTLLKIQVLANFGIADADIQPPPTPPTAEEIAIAFIQNYAQNGGTAPSLQQYTNAGIKGITSANLSVVNAKLSNTTATDTVEKIQTLVNLGIADIIPPSPPTPPIIPRPPTAEEIALAFIQNYAQNGGTAPSLQQYINAGITGVTSTNLSVVNAKVLANDIVGTNKLTKIQTLVNLSIAVKPVTPVAPPSDTTAPTLAISDDRDDTISNSNKDIVFTFTFSEDVTGFDIDDITITNASKGTFSTTNASTYTLAAIVEDNKQGNITISISSNDIVDSSNNALLTTPIITYTHEVDTIVPTVSSLSFTSPTQTYVSGDDINVSVEFSENVTVTGTPSIGIKIGSVIKQATYASGTGNDTLVFTYTLVVGDEDPDGIEVESSSIDLNSGTIKDSAGNDSTLTHDAIIQDANRLVDTPPTLIISSHANDQNISIRDALNIVLNGTSNAENKNVTISHDGTDLKTTTVSSGNWTADTISFLDGKSREYIENGVASTDVPDFLRTSTKEALDNMLDRDLNTSDPNNYAVHPEHANGKYISIKFSNTYVSGEFKFYNRIHSGGPEKRIEGSTVQFLSKDIILWTSDPIRNAGTTVTLTPPKYIVFDEMKIVFSGDNQNFREIEVYGIPFEKDFDLVLKVTDNTSNETVKNLNLNIIPTLKSYALAFIQNYAQDGEAAPSLQEYIDAGINNVTVDNLSAVNARIEASNTVGTDTVAKIQALVDLGVGEALAFSVIRNYTINASTAPTETNYTTAGITGVNTVDKASALNALIQGHSSGSSITLTQIQTLANSIIQTPTTIIGLPSNITITNNALKVYVLSVNDEDYDNLDIQDTINNVTTLKVQIPYTVASGTVSLPSHSQSFTISDTTLSSEGESNVIVSFTYDAQTDLSGSGVFEGIFTIDDSSSTGANDNIYKAKKLDIDDNAPGFTLANFKYAVDASDAPNDLGTLTIQVIPGIADRNYNVADLTDTSAFNHKFIYMPVVSPKTGKTWLNNNLGAQYSNVTSGDFNPSQQATSITDYKAYGSLVQWGRKADGHELATWASDGVPTSKYTITNIKSDDPAHSSFIETADIDIRYWRDTIDNTLWKNENSNNNVCPVGFRVPTAAELEEELAGLVLESAFHSFLKTTANGLRHSVSGYAYLGTRGNLWSSDIHVSSDHGTLAKYLGINPHIDDTKIWKWHKAYGKAVRCIKD